MEDTYNFPLIPKPLLERLEHVYPNKLPEHLPSEAEMGRMIGRQDVIGFLRMHYNRQNRPQETP